MQTAKNANSEFNKFIKENRVFVLQTLAKCKFPPIKYEDVKDLRQEALLGLYKAIQNRKSCMSDKQFLVYARKYMMGFVLRALKTNKHRVITYPSNFSDIISKVRRYEQKYGDIVDKKEVAKQFGCSIQRLDLALTIKDTYLNEYVPIDNYEDCYIAGVSRTVDTVEDNIDKNRILNNASMFFAKRAHQMRSQIAMRLFGLCGFEPMKPKDIAKELNVRIERIYTDSQEAINTYKNYLVKHNYYKY